MAAAARARSEAVDVWMAMEGGNGTFANMSLGRSFKIIVFFNG